MKRALLHASARRGCSGIRHFGITNRQGTIDNLERQLQVAKDEAQVSMDRDPITGLLHHGAFLRRIDEAATDLATGAAAPVSIGIVIVDLRNFRFINEAHGYAAGDDVLRQVAARLAAICRPRDLVARFGGDEFAVALIDCGSLTPAGLEERILTGCDDLFFQSTEQMHPIPIVFAAGAAILAPDASPGGCAVTARTEAIHAAEERLHWHKWGFDTESDASGVRLAARKSTDGFSMLDALVTAVDNKDRYTRQHSEDVMSYSLMIARELGLSEEVQRQIAIAALLHDVGKIGVPDFILRKPAALTDDEFEAVKRHPEVGAVMVSAVRGLDCVLDAVRHHHERWDGRGYPSGLKGLETPLAARLMAVADAFDAMTTDRPYRKAMSDEQAVSLLQEGAGAQWDPQCVEAFNRAFQRQPAACQRFQTPASATLCFASAAPA